MVNESSKDSNDNQGPVQFIVKANIIDIPHDKYIQINNIGFLSGKVKASIYILNKDIELLAAIQTINSPETMHDKRK